MTKERQVREQVKAYAAFRQADPTAGRDGLEAQPLRAERYMADQSQVWAEVRDSSRSLGSHSPTLAMADAYEFGKSDLDKILEVFDPDRFATGKDTVGALVFLGGQFVCLDVLRPAVRFRHLYPKLLRGYALEALMNKGEEPKDFDAQAAALRLIAEMLEASVEEQPAADLGIDLRLETKEVSGSGLLWQDELIQLSMFPQAAA